MDINGSFKHNHKKHGVIIISIKFIFRTKLPNILKSIMMIYWTYELDYY